MENKLIIKREKDGIRMALKKHRISSASSIDLHLHTTFSDGIWTPEQLLDYLVKEQFSLAAITDHDRADTVATLRQLALDSHLPLIAGVEMTTLWKTKCQGKMKG